MNNPFVNSGTVFSVSTALPVTEDQAGYEALTYTQIRGVRSIGDIGVQYETMDCNMIGQVRRNAIVDEGAKTLTLELIKITDAGQTILSAASAAITELAFKISPPDGTTFYFSGNISSRITGLTGIADIKMTLELNTELLEI